MSFDVAQPIQNPPYDEPSKYWFIQEGSTPQLKDGRRPAMVFQPRDQRDSWDDDGIIRKLTEYERGYELVLVNVIRESVRRWRAEDYPGVTRTTYDLLQHWRRSDRGTRLFFAQLEAAETVIFVKEARSDFLQGIDVPLEDVSDEAHANGVTGFERLACKMASGSGKSTVMAMLAAWSILNKVNDEDDARFSDVVLIVTPNITIRDRLCDLDPLAGEASLYPTRDLAPRAPHAAPGTRASTGVYFILVCKNTKIAGAAFEWLANGNAPPGVPQSSLDYFRNRDGAINTIRVDTKVVDEVEMDGAKGDEVRWMRFTLDTIGKRDWPRDSQGRALYPDGFEALAHKLERPLDPPGRDVRCIVSVGMLTEGWDANTVTHIVGLRPFMSQLLCEQVVGRGLRRVSYEPGDDGLLPEEVAQVLGVPFEVIPFKATAGAPAPQPTKRVHVHALPERREYEIRFPHVEWYRQVIQRKVVVDWDAVPPLVLDPMRVPPEVLVGNYVPNTSGAPSTFGVGRVQEMTLRQYRLSRRLQSRMFELARDITQTYLSPDPSKAPAHELFPQMYRIVEAFVRDKVESQGEYEVEDAFLGSFYSSMRERILSGIRPDVAEGEPMELPLYVTGREEGSTADVDFWSSKATHAVRRSHVNYVVADTTRWEQAAAERLDRHRIVTAFVKNSGLGFTIPYTHNGESHEFYPDFIARLATDPVVHLILETKGYDPLDEVKEAAAQRWVKAVNADGKFGRWAFRVARNPNDVAQLLAMAEMGEVA